MLTTDLCVGGKFHHGPNVLMVNMLEIQSVPHSVVVYTVHEERAAPATAGRKHTNTF